MFGAIAVYCERKSVQATASALTEAVSIIILRELRSSLISEGWGPR